MTDLFKSRAVMAPETCAEASVPASAQEQPAKEAATPDFDWEGEHVVCQRQPRSAVYRNRFEQVVIRQEGDYPDDDIWMIFTDAVVPQLIRHLAAQIGVLSDVNDALLKNEL